MAENESTFHESWYRVAGLKVTLRTHLRFHRQHMRGERWHVLEDPFSNQFFRLREAAWDFVARLDGRRSVDEAWKESLEANPETAPGQSEVIRLLAQLYSANLVISDLPADTANLFKRFSKRRQREFIGHMTSFMFARLPLFDPDNFLVRTLPWIRWIYTKIGAILWLAVVAFGLKTVIENGDRLLAEGGDVLAPSNLPLLYVGIALLAILHELGHAFTCRRLGGEVHTMGIMLLVFTPLPYVDVTSSWAFRGKYRRMAVGAAGMIVELFVAGIAAVIWAKTDAPGVVHGLAFNVMFAASVSTILFNANPLLRFDGYYLLSDYLGLPNLYSRAQKQLMYFFERHVFGVRTARSEARSRREGVWLTVYGIASLIYRIIVFGSIILFVSSQFLLLGVLLGIFCLVAWVAVPTGKFIHYLATSPKLARTRQRAAVATVLMVGLPLAALYYIPAPRHAEAPGVIRAERMEAVSPIAGGALVEVFVPSGEWVEAGTKLLRLEDPELDLQMAAARAELAGIEARIGRALEEGGADYQAVLRLRDSVNERIAFLQSQMDGLTVKAPIAGTWVAPRALLDNRRWIRRGEPMGLIVDERSMLFSAVVGQGDVGALFADPVKGAEIRLRGQAGEVIVAHHLLVVPAERRNLPSAALGWLGGGEVAVDRRDAQGRRAGQGFFEVRASLEENHEAALFHGQRGRIRFDLPAEPFLQQWIRKARQLFQRTYGPTVKSS
jgi:putative peptide zinc metalloprotease protein